jgi:hypothetical protein
MRYRSIGLLPFVLAACGSGNSTGQSAVNCTKMGAKTGVAGAKTGVLTGVEGVKTAGKAVGGLVTGGSDQAQKEWHEGKAETKRTAHSGADEVRREAHAPDCP